jgi:fused signal recognition particle receptor
MFKNLRKKLSRFEEELESALDEELERQLQEAVSAEDEMTPPEAKPAPAATPPEQAPEPQPEPEPEPAAREGPAPEVEPGQSPELEPEPPAPVPDQAESAPEPKGEPKAEPTLEPKPEPKPAPEQAPAPEPAPKPSEPAAKPEAKPPEGKVRTRRPGAPVVKTDKQIAEEVEASLARELERDVQATKELERMVSERGEGVVARLSEERLDDLLWELEVVLLESDVALPVVEAIKKNVRERLVQARVPRRGAGEFVEEVLRAAIRQVLNEPFDFDGFIEKSEKPVVVMFVGVNGTGKTTSIAKIAHRLKGQGRSVVLAAGDTFRAGAVAQLERHSERLGVKMIKHEGEKADPAAVAYDAIEHAKSRRKEVVLLDTAGRQQTNKNLMAEMEKIKRVAQPDLILFVGDSLAGNDAVAQADRFNEVVGIDGVVLTKVDADAKGGAALSVAYAIGKPLVFIGLGQEYEDQVPFDRDWMLDRLFGTEAEEEAQAAA